MSVRTKPPPGVPEPPEYLPEMADELIVKNTVKVLSPRIVAVHGPTGTGKSTVFPLAIAHWAEQKEGLKSGLTLCAQPRRILAQQLCERVRLNRKMHKHDKTVGYKIARDSSRNTMTKLLYCTEAIVAMMMQQYLVSSNDEDVQDVITTVVIDEVHNRSAHSDYVLALTLAAMQKHSHLRLVLMSATGDHSLVEERIPHCQQLVMKGAASCQKMLSRSIVGSRFPKHCQSTSRDFLSYTSVLARCDCKLRVLFSSFQGRSLGPLSEPFLEVTGPARTPTVKALRGMVTRECHQSGF